MIFDYNLFSTFREYLDYKVCSVLGAYRDVNALELVEDTSDTKIAGMYKTLAGRSQQWVYDASLGSNIASASEFAGTDWENAIIDFKNARVHMPTATSDADPPTIAVAEKHFNSYITTQTDQEIYMSLAVDAERRNKEGDTTSGTFTPYDDYSSPAYFLKLFRTMNKPLGYGGLDQSFFEINVTAFCNNEAEMIGLGSVFRDMQHRSFFLFDQTPLTYYNGLKPDFSSYSFEEYTNDMKIATQPQVFIEEVMFNPVKSDGTNNKLPNINIGIGKFKLFIARYPRKNGEFFASDHSIPFKLA